MKKIVAIIFWIVVVLFLALWTFEFYMVKFNHEPMFCLKHNSYQFEDGTVDECIGLGYKVFKYERSSLYGSEFTFMFGQMKQEQDS